MAHPWHIRCRPEMSTGPATPHLICGNDKPLLSWTAPIRLRESQIGTARGTGGRAAPGAANIDCHRLPVIFDPLGAGADLALSRPSPAIVARKRPFATIAGRHPRCRSLHAQGGSSMPDQRNPAFRSLAGTVEQPL